MDYRSHGSSAASAVLVGLAAFIGCGFLLLPSFGIKTIYLAAAGVAAAGVALTYVSGNLRLVCLYAVALAAPFDLSKKFGPELIKMGGETQFRVEFYDPFVLLLAYFQIRDVWRGRIPGFRIPRVAFLWLGIAAMGLIPLILGPYRTTAAHEMVRMLKVTLLFLVIVNELRTEKRLVHFAVGLASSVILQSSVGLVERYRGKLLGLSILGETNKATIDQLATQSVLGETVVRVAAFLMHPNLFGMFLAVLLPLMIGCFFLNLGSRRKLIFLAAVVLAPPALIATLSRSSWVSAATGVAVMAFLLFAHKELRPRIILPAALTVVVLAGVAFAFGGPIMRRLFESRSGATVARQELEADAWLLIQQKPVFGWDLNSYALNVPLVMKVGPRGSHKMWGNLFPVVHNTYLLWWMELGLVGLALHLWLWFWMIASAVRNLRVRSPILFVINAACLSGLLTYIPDGFFSFSTRMNNLLRMYWIVAGMVAAIRYLRLQETWAVRQAAQLEPERTPVLETVAAP